MIPVQQTAKESSKPDKQISDEELPEIESISSSLSYTTTSETFVSLHETTDVQDVQDIFEMLYDTESESLEEEGSEYDEHKSLIDETNLVDTFGRLPDVDNISEDVSVASLTVDKKADDKEDIGDSGKFVNPLTGLYVTESMHHRPSSIEINLKEKDEKKEDVEAGDSVKDKDLSEESELLIPDDVLDEIEVAKKPVDLEDTFEAFLELETKQDEIKLEEIDWEALAREKEAKHLEKLTRKFLDDLVNHAVEAAEYMSPEKYLQQNLDKYKLMMELAKKLPEYLEEKSTSSFLNRQIVHHFRRKKTFRPIMEDNPRTVEQDKQKLKNAKLHLDEVLEKEAKLKESLYQMKENLCESIKVQKEDVENQITEFENKVWKHLGRELWPKTNTLIDQLLMQMKKYRNEISEVRMTLLLQQHSQAHLEGLLNKLEDLGNGLNMKDFTHLQAETQTLDKKIEERNAELNKYYLRCHSDLHIMANCQEKQKMLSHTVCIQKTFLNSLLQEKRNLRERLYSLKLQRNRMNAQIKSLSIQGGLLDKPALMLDYDHTVIRCRDQKELNNYLKRTMENLQKKIEDISKHCLDMKN
ncbi:uncharacterized protein ACRADG_007398 [Cochliomyia hominivorax]